MKNVRWAVFLSGQGSTAQAFFDLKNEINLQLIVSNRRSAPGLKRARRAGLPTLQFSKAMSWEVLADELKRRRICAIFLLGFMTIVPAAFIEKFAMINVHPSLLPQFPDLHALEQSFENPVSDLGVTIHQVTPAVDEGPRFLQSMALAADKKKSFADARFQVALTEQRLIRSGGHRFDRSLHAG